MKGDRNVVEVDRLRGNCPKCGFKIKTAQTVDRHQDYNILKHWCENCGKMLGLERFELVKVERKKKRWI